MQPLIGLSFATLLLAASLSSAPALEPSKIVGNGVLKEENREVPAFHSIDVSGVFEATLSIGPKASVLLNLEENLLSLTRTEVINGVLFVSFAKNSHVESHKPAKVTVVVPALESVAVRGVSRVFATLAESKSLRVVAEGASHATLEGLASESIDVKIEGASQVVLSGRGTSLKLDAMGASNLLGEKMIFDSARISINGSSKVVLKVTDSIEGDLSGASSLKVLGNPKIRHLKTSGASSVTD